MTTPTQGQRVRSRLGPEAITAAATELFAERGVDGVSLADIRSASGHRNRSAVAYHFGSKEELVRTLITQVVDAHDSLRMRLLDQLERADTAPALPQVLAVAVAPMADDLTERPRRLRLRMLANVVTDERHMGFVQQLMLSHPGLGRSTALIAGHLSGLPEAIRNERIVLATTFGLRAFADQARLIDSPTPDRDPLGADVFAPHVVELLEALLTAPHRPVR